MAAFQVLVHEHPEVTMIALRGDLDMSTVPTLDGAIESRRDRLADLVIFDALELQFAGVRGMTALLGHTRRLRNHGHRVVVVNMAESISSTLELLFAPHPDQRADRIDTS